MGLLKTHPHRNYLLLLSAIFAILWVLLAIHPYDRKDWLLENVLVLGFAVGLIASYRKFTFSRVSYTLIFVFMCLHAVGSHYTYALVPYDRGWQALTGHSFNEMVGWQRNNFDRLVHFCYGLLFAYPLREVFLRVADARGFWGYFLPLDFTLATSAIYELIEWAAAEFFGGELGAAYLGTQGDIWDAHKDMAAAGTGALIAMLATAALNLWLQRDFAREWSESLKIKDGRPLGEDEIRRLLQQRT
jgi:putative membrane protein